MYGENARTGEVFIAIKYSTQMPSKRFSLPNKSLVLSCLTLFFLTSYSTVVILPILTSWSNLLQLIGLLMSKYGSDLTER